MSTFTSNESRLGSSRLHFPRLSLQSPGPASKGAEPAIPLIDCIGGWAAENPKASAITSATETLSYFDLEAQSNALARHLISLGATKESLVAIVLERSPEFVIAALAAWKAGAAYLPLDPSSPPERIRLILNDARVPILVRSGITSQIELSQELAKQVDVSDRRSLLRAYSSASLPNKPEKSQLAYVIFTSGSTGRPKGVEITHQNLLNLVGYN